MVTKTVTKAKASKVVAKTVVVQTDKTTAVHARNKHRVNSRLLKVGKRHTSAQRQRSSQHHKCQTLKLLSLASVLTLAATK